MDYKVDLSIHVSYLLCHDHYTFDTEKEKEESKEKKDLKREMNIQFDYQYKKNVTQ